MTIVVHFQSSHSEWTDAISCCLYGSELVWASLILPEPSPLTITRENFPSFQSQLSQNYSHSPSSVTQTKTLDSSCLGWPSYLTIPHLTQEPIPWDLLSKCIHDPTISPNFQLGLCHHPFLPGFLQQPHCWSLCFNHCPPPTVDLQKNSQCVLCNS